MPDFNLISIVLRAKGSKQVKQEFDDIDASAKKLKSSIKDLKANPFQGSSEELKKMEASLKSLDGPLSKAKKKLTEGFDKSSVESFNREMQGIASISPILGSLVGKVGLLYAAFLTLRAGARVAREAIKAVAEQELGINRLNIAFQSMGAFSAKASSDMQAFADELKRTSRFSDQAVLSAAALIAQLGRLQGDALKQATQGAVDLAVGLGRDLGTAALIVAKAAQGSTFELRKYGLVIDRNVPKAERFARVLEFLSTKFGGVAEAEVRTASASYDQFKNAITDVGEVLGAPVVIALLPALKATTRAMFDFVEQAKKIPAIAELFDPTELNIDKALKKFDRGFFEDAKNFIPKFEIDLIGGDFLGVNIGLFKRKFDEEFSDLKIAVDNTVLKGSIAEALATVDKLRAAVANSEGELRSVFSRALSLAESDLELRLTINTAAASASVNNLFKSIETLEPEIEVLIGRREDVQNAREIVEAVKSLPQNQKLIDDTAADALTDVNSEYAVMLRQLQKIKAETSKALDSGNMEELKKVGVSLNDTLKRLTEGSSKEVFNQADIGIAELLLQLVDRLDAKLPLEAKSILENEAKIRVDQLSDSIRELTKAKLASGKLELFSADDLARSDTLTEALERVEKEALALEKVKSPVDAQTGFERILRTLAILERQFPAAAEKIRVVLERLSDDFGKKYEVIVETYQANQALKELGDAAARVRKGFDQSIGSLFDTAGLNTANKSLGEMETQLGAVITEAQKLGKVDTLKDVFRDASAQLAVLEEAAKDAADGLNEDLAGALRLIILLSGNALKALVPLENLNRFQLEFETSIDLNNFDAALAKFGEMVREFDRVNATLADGVKLGEQKDLNDAVDSLRQLRQALSETSKQARDIEEEILRLYVLLAQDPGNIDIQVRIDGLERSLKGLAKYEAAIESTKEAMRSLLIDFSADLLSAPFQAILNDAENFSEKMQQIFKDMVSAIIKELAKLLIYEGIKALLRSFGVPIPVGVPTGAPGKPGLGGGPLGDGNSPKPQQGDLPILPPFTLIDLTKAISSLPKERIVRIEDRFDPSLLLPRPEPRGGDLHVYTPDIKGLVSSYRRGELGRAQAVVAQPPRRAL